MIAGPIDNSLNGNHEQRVGDNTEDVQGQGEYKFDCRNIHQRDSVMRPSSLLVITALLPTGALAGDYLMQLSLSDAVIVRSANSLCVTGMPRSNE